MDIVSNVGRWCKARVFKRFWLWPLQIISIDSRHTPPATKRFWQSLQYISSPRICFPVYVIMYAWIWQNVTSPTILEANTLVEQPVSTRALATLPPPKSLLLIGSLVAPSLDKGGSFRRTPLQPFPWSRLAMWLYEKKAIVKPIVRGNWTHSTWTLLDPFPIWLFYPKSLKM